MSPGPYPECMAETHAAADGRRPGLGTPRWAGEAWDVLVVGGGNAAVAAAFAANDLRARVLLVERATREMRGGNSRHTRNIRCVHDPDDYNSGVYSYDEMWKDLSNVGDGPNDEELAEFTVRASRDLPPWMQSHGARWQRPLAGTLQLGRTNRFFLGGGKALLNSYYRTLSQRRGVEVAYEAKLEEFEFDGNRMVAALISCAGSIHRITPRAVICASGGFEANIEWLRQYWGSAADNYIIRGTPHNDGNVLRALLDAHAASAGQERGFHAIALDARAPKFDGGIATRLDTVPFGIVLNRDGVRFYDEGEDLWPKRYAMWGRHIAQQPGQIAYAFWDAKVDGLFLPPMYGSYASDDIGDLARQLGLDPAAVQRTLAEYNSAVSDDGAFDPAVLDDCSTHGITPAKTHWAQRIDAPPYHAVPMRPGITFTYMGVAVRADARVRRADGSVFENVFAAGEIMSGNILSTGYLAGIGMTIGTVWGRVAGTEAARDVR